MRDVSDRFSELEHLSWARAQRAPHSHHLAASAIPAPPRDVFDPEGPVLLDIQQGAERALLEMLATRYQTRPDELLLTAGVSEGLYAAAASLLEPGDVAVVEQPRYQSLAAVPRSLGAHVVDLVRQSDGALDKASIRESFARARALASRERRRVAAVFVADPNNPTGRRLDDDTLDALVEGASALGATVVLDEVYRDLDDRRPISSARRRHPDCITLNSLTKCYGLGGLRLGWLQAPPAARERAARVQRHLSVLPAAPSVGVALRVMPAADRILAWAAPRLRDNRARLREAMDARPGGFVWSDAGTCGSIAFALRPGGPDTRPEARAWSAERGLAVVPGAWFEAPSGVRLGIGGDPEAFAAALAVWLEAVRAPARAGSATQTT